MKKFIATFLAYLLFFLAANGTGQPNMDPATGFIIQDKLPVTEMGKRFVPEEKFIPGEALIVKVFGDSGSIINGAYPIDAAGYVDFPIIGKVYVADKIRSVLQGYLSTELANYMRDINISITPAIRIAFVGNFKNPGMFFAHPNQVVWDAFLASQGPAAEGQLQEMYILRGTDILSTHPLDIFSSGTTLKEAGIQSGDIFALPLPPRRDFFDYFTIIVSTTATLATVAATVLNVWMIYDLQMYGPGR